MRRRAWWTSPTYRMSEVGWRPIRKAGAAMGVQVKASGDTLRGETAELFATHQSSGAAGPYERLLLDAVRGDGGLFAREDEVDAAWRIVDPVRADLGPVYPYAAGSWGPEEANRFIQRNGGWHRTAGSGK